MVRVALGDEVPLRLIDCGEIVQLRLVSAAEQPKLTTPLNPPRGATLMVEVADCPGLATLTLDGLADTLKSVTVTVTGADADAR
jgi:hypothetical protein